MRVVKKDKPLFHCIEDKLLYLIVKGFHGIFYGETISNYLQYWPLVQVGERGDSL